MSPRNATLLALAGVLLAGVPLTALTASRPEERAASRKAAPATAEEGLPAFLTVRFTGEPEELVLRCEGSELARLNPVEDSSPWELDVRLPSGAAQTLEVEARWDSASPDQQAVTITLEPSRLPARSDTHWADPVDNTLHSLFEFTWQE